MQLIKLVTKQLILKEENDDRFFEGILTVEMMDKQGEITIAEELYKALPAWMDNGGAMSDTHSNRIIGKGINFEKVVIHDQKGESYPAIKIMGKIQKNTALADEIWNKMKSGEYKGLSFGGATKNDRTPVRQKDGSLAYELKDLEIYEIAICEDPAVPFAMITEMNVKAKTFLRDESIHPFLAKEIEDENITVKCDGINCYVSDKDMNETLKSLNINKPLPNPSGGTPFKDFDACETWANNQDHVRNAQGLCGSIENRTHGNPMKKGEDELSEVIPAKPDSYTPRMEKAGNDFAPSGDGKYRSEETRDHKREGALKESVYDDQVTEEECPKCTSQKGMTPHMVDEYGRVWYAETKEGQGSLFGDDVIHGEVGGDTGEKKGGLHDNPNANEVGLGHTCPGCKNEPGKDHETKKDYDFEELPATHDDQSKPREAEKIIGAIAGAAAGAIGSAAGGDEKSGDNPTDTPPNPEEKAEDKDKDGFGRQGNVVTPTDPVMLDSNSSGTSGYSGEKAPTAKCNKCGLDFTTKPVTDSVLGSNATNARGIGAYNTTQNGPGRSAQIEETQEKAETKPTTLENFGNPEKLSKPLDPIHDAPKKSCISTLLWSNTYRKKTIYPRKKNIHQLLFG